MRVPLPIPNQPQPTPFPSAVRCEIFVVPIPNNNLSPVRGGISPPRARPFRPAGAWDFIGHGAQAGQAPVKPGKTNFTGSCSHHACSKSLQINARPHCQAESRLRTSQINNDGTPCAKINCYPQVGIVMPNDVTRWPLLVNCLFAPKRVRTSRGRALSLSSRPLRSKVRETLDADSWDEAASFKATGFSPPSPGANWAASSIDLPRSVRSIMQA
jgi:hypothetical protein